MPLLICALAAAAAFLAWYYPAPGERTCAVCGAPERRVLHGLLPTWLCDGHDSHVRGFWWSWWLVWAGFSGWSMPYRPGENYTRAAVRRIRHALFCRGGCR